ncbi:MAG: type II secretion system protein N [Gallionellaceae bacterium]|nr:type II secretion system protein N [Gallionellaceae bacterium]
MMNRMLRIVLAVSALLVLLLAQAPATWLDRALQRASSGLVGLADARGTLWRGNGTVQAILPSGRVETLEAVRWTVDPWALFALHLHIAMTSERDGKPVLDATLAPTGFTVSELRLDAPAALLGVLSPTIRGAQITGRLSVRASGIRADRQTTTGSANLTWSDAGSALTPIYPLGSYMVNLRGVGKGMEFTLSTLAGALTLSGSGQWQPGSPLAFNGTARPAPDQARQLTPLLRILGREGRDGSYQIALSNDAALASH